MRQWLCSLSSVSFFFLPFFLLWFVFMCMCACLNQNGLELEILLLPACAIMGGGGETQASHMLADTASRATFPAPLFFLPQSETAAGMRKSGPLPSAEVQCHGCCVTYGRGGDHSP